ncbi:hypothetical protein BDN72DRAFT_857117 [Pluteus cervinus]|uniref:Uncharacterized protein n=1 Tax=Pluteus cervinus TaxID=181527 RepID=A0ACD3AWU4_9AGAR|nr:hypothetical protein BDN72DRAFT_857117 [Pluteus cervinus]
MALKRWRHNSRAKPLGPGRSRVSSCLLSASSSLLLTITPASSRDMGIWPVCYCPRPTSPAKPLGSAIEPDWVVSALELDLGLACGSQAGFKPRVVVCQSGQDLPSNPGPDLLPIWVGCRSQANGGPSHEATILPVTNNPRRASDSKSTRTVNANRREVQDAKMRKCAGDNTVEVCGGAVLRKMMPERWRVSNGREMHISGVEG